VQRLQVERWDVPSHGEQSGGWCETTTSLRLCAPVYDS